MSEGACGFSDLRSPKINPGYELVSGEAQYLWCEILIETEVLNRAM